MRNTGYGFRSALIFLYLFSFNPVQAQECRPAKETRPVIEKDAVSGSFTSRFVSKKSVCQDWPVRRGLDMQKRFVYFTWDNLSPAVLPPDPEGKARRQWIFQFLERARQNIHLSLMDDVALTGRDSRDTMHTVLYFFPRRQLPHYEIISLNEMRVWLPTGEDFVVDRMPGKILRGVLEETGPMDRRANRFTRKFARIAYHGKGIMVRIDQRGNQPEESTVFGKYNPFKTALATYQGKSCRIRPGELWTQQGYVNFKFPTDEEFYAFLEKKCKWQVRETMLKWGE